MSRNILIVAFAMAVLALGGCNDTTFTTQDAGSDVQVNEAQPIDPGLSGSGTDAEAVADAASEAAAPVNVTYEIINDWEWHAKDRGVAKLEKQLEGGEAPFTKLTFSSIKPGTEEDARQEAYEHYLPEKERCERNPACNDPDPDPEFTTMDFDGTKVYAYITPTRYWGVLAWHTVFAFEKDGQVAEFVLNGERPDRYQEELATIIKTISWK